MATTPFDAVPFHLTYKCDGCLYNEFCMKWSAEHDDLSLLPHLTEQEKGALRRAGVTTTSATGRAQGACPTTTRARTSWCPSPARRRSGAAAGGHLAGRPAPRRADPPGPALPQLRKDDEIASLTYIPSKGYGSLPYADADRTRTSSAIYIDAQHDYLNDRIYLLGALVVACEDGVEVPRRALVHRAHDRRPAGHAEQRGAAVRRLDRRDAAGGGRAGRAGRRRGSRSAPIHLIFFNRFEQRLLLEGSGAPLRRRSSARRRSTTS